MWETAVDTRGSILFACRYLPATCGAELGEKQQMLIIALSFSKFPSCQGFIPRGGIAHLILLRQTVIVHS
jgi:hypothetical protein